LDGALLKWLGLATVGEIGGLLTLTFGAIFKGSKKVGLIIIDPSVRNSLLSIAAGAGVGAAFHLPAPRSKSHEGRFGVSVPLRWE